tara:strand:+ start:243 stop:1394 length:1152 start_codon:yes stop_codon:yes gene_type:complete
MSADGGGSNGGNEANGADETPANPSSNDANHDQGDAESSEGKSSKKTWIKIAAIVAIVLIAIFGFRAWNHSRHYVSTEDAFLDAQVVRMSPQIAGTIEKLDVDSNQLVKQGDLLVRISPDTILPKLEGGRAGVANAQAQLSEARSRVTSAQAACRAARSQVGEPASKLSEAQTDLRRLEQARSRDPATVAAQDIDTARSAVASATAALRSARANADQVCSQAQAAQEAVRSAQAGIASAKAEKQGAQISLDQSEIRAPFNGWVSNLSVNTGSYVTPGSQMMALVPERIFVTANFKETDLAKLKVGDPVTIKVDAYPDRELNGRIASFQRAAGQEFQLLPAQNATGNFVKVVQRVPVRIEFTDPLPDDMILGPGMSVIPTVRYR